MSGQEHDRKSFSSSVSHRARTFVVKKRKKTRKSAIFLLWNLLVENAGGVKLVADEQVFRDVDKSFFFLSTTGARF